MLRRLATGFVLGMIAGALFLGVGGRLVMRLFALATNRPWAFTLGGSVNVVLAGAIAGGIGGIALATIHRFLPRRLWRRGVLFAVICYLIAIPGFRPPKLLVFALFAPVFLAYGMVLELAWERFGRGRK